jgi:hypothetical protein
VRDPLIGSIMGLAVVSPASAAMMRASVAFNNGIGTKTATQPDGGVEVTYQITLKGGELDGCTVAIVEQLYPREDGAWDTFFIDGDVTCTHATLAYASAGSWDGAALHAAGTIKGGTGRFDGVKGRVAQIGGGAKPAGDGTADIFYDLLIDAS